MVSVREIELNQTYPAVPGSVPSARRAIAEFAAEAGVSDLAALEKEIKETDAKIDQLVYELYGLSDDEIKIVEGAQC